MLSDPPRSAEAHGDNDRALRRPAFLADAGEVLSASLDYEDTLRHVARLVVRDLGDLCVLDVVEEGVLRRVASAHRLPDKDRLVEALAGGFPAREGSPSPAARVFASGTTELLEQLTADLVASHTRDADHSALVRAIGMRSHIAVPMLARGTVVGVLSVGITERDRRDDAEDVRAVEELGRRAALAVDNARLYRAFQRELERRRQVEEELRFSEARSRAILAQSPLSTQVLAPDGRTRTFNRAWELLWGLRLEQLEGYSVLQDPQLEVTGIAPLRRRAFAGEAVVLPAIAYDVRDRDPDAVDPIRWVTAFAYPVHDDQERIREVVLVHQDVSEARRAEERLRASESRLNRAVSAGAMVVWEWDLGTDAIACSDNADAFWGVRVEHASELDRVVHPDDAHLLREAAVAAAERNEPYRVEYRLRRPDGGVRWVQSRAQIERAADGRPVRILGVTLENTERKLAEDATPVLADAGRILGTSLDYQATLAAFTLAVVPGFADWCAIDLRSDDGQIQRVAVAGPDPAHAELSRARSEASPPVRGARRGRRRAARGAGHGHRHRARGPGAHLRDVHARRRAALRGRARHRSDARAPIGRAARREPAGRERRSRPGKSLRAAPSALAQCTGERAERTARHHGGPHCLPPGPGRRRQPGRRRNAADLSRDARSSGAHRGRWRDGLGTRAGVSAGRRVSRHRSARDERPRTRRGLPRRPGAGCDHTDRADGLGSRRGPRAGAGRRASTTT